MIIRLLTILLLISFSIFSFAEEVSGTVVSKGKSWIAVARVGDADSTLYMPQWKGSAFDPDMLAKIGEVPVGAEVKLTFKTDDHPRLLTLEVTAAKGQVALVHIAKAPDKPVPDRPVPDKPVPDKPMLDKPPVVLPSGEAALKADGWTTVTGNWKKKAERVYEVTDGKLEAKKTNGLIQAVVHRGTGSIKICVRNGFDDPEYTGFGVILSGSNCRVVTPYMGDDIERTRFTPYLEKTSKLTAGLAKDEVIIQILDSKLQIMVDGKREKLANYKISQKGPFVIEVSGTAIIEFPIAKDEPGL
jgi:hypothetical protein